MDGRHSSTSSGAAVGAPAFFQVDHDLADTTFTVAGRKTEAAGQPNFSIHQIARNADPETLRRYLVSLGEKKSRVLNELDENGRSALHYAARYKKLGAVQLLVESGADVDVRDEDWNTPLHYAARYIKMKKPALGKHGAGSPVRRPSFEVPTYPQTPPRHSKAVDVMVQSISFFTGAGGSPVLQQKGSEPAADPMINYLISKGANRTAKDLYGSTPLHLAATRANSTAISELLRHLSKKQVDDRDEQKMTPLHLASGRANAESLLLLLAAGADYLACDDQGRTPFHIAATEGNAEAIRTLLLEVERRGDGYVSKMLQMSDLAGNTALHLAVENGQSEVVEELIKKSTDTDVNKARVDQSTPLHLAAVAGDLSVVEKLVDRGAVVDAADVNWATALHKAAAFNHVAVTKYLIARGAYKENLDKDNMTPLLLAANQGNAEVVRVLLQSGANIFAFDTDEMTALCLAALHNHASVAEVLLYEDNEGRLLSMGDQHDETPLHIACTNGFIEIAKLLLEKNASLSSKNEEEETPAHLAAKHGMEHIVSLLLSHDKTIVADSDGNANTPLHLAAIAGHVAVASLLLHAGANIAARNSNMWTPIDCAAAHGHYGVVKLLLEANSPVDPMDKTKTTPLHLACARGRADVVELLIKNGADVKLLNHEGFNCIDLAIMNGHSAAAASVVQSEKWMDAMQHANVNIATKTYDTPLRKLIRKMPDVAEMVLDRCIDENGTRSDSLEYEINYNYELLDDQYASWWGQSPSSGTKTAVYNEDGRVRGDAERYNNNDGLITRNHPLMIMVLSRRKNLLGHKVAKGLLAHKWRTYGRYTYYTRLGLYAIFLACLTGFAMVTPAPDAALLGHCDSDSPSEGFQKCDSRTAQEDCAKEPSSNNGTEPFDCSNITCASQAAAAGNLSALVKALQLYPPGAASFFNSFGIYYVLVFSALNMGAEALQLAFSRRFYFRWDKIPTWVLHLSCFMFIVNSSTCSKDYGFLEPYQWEAGTVAVFLAWMELILFVRKLPVFGIYVVMFMDILRTFLKFCVVFFLFVVAFALSFYMLFQRRVQFSSPGKSLIRTAVMMLGEFDFDGLFNEGDAFYPEVSYVVFILFAIFMPILLMNMMVGLAVDDISEVQKQAVLKRLAMQVELVLGVEAALPQAFIKRKMIRGEVRNPNLPGKCKLFKETPDNTDDDSKREIDELASLNDKQDKLQEVVSTMNEQLSALLMRNQKLEDMLAVALARAPRSLSGQDPLRGSAVSRLGGEDPYEEAL